MIRNMKLVHTVFTMIFVTITTMIIENLKILKKKWGKMTMALTDAQKAAVLSNGNVIVSAGAGSGKTTVLTARVIDKIINNHVDISEFLIVTFTNAAAKQMRDKIKVALLNKNLSNLVNKVDSAHIETFDAFALYVVKKYGYLLGLPLTINNVPTDVIQVKTYNIINDIFNRYYESKDPVFLELINTYCIKDDKDLATFVYNFHDVYAKQENKKEYLETYYDKYLTDEIAKAKVVEYFDNLKLLRDRIRLDISQFKEQRFKDAYQEYYGNVLTAENFHELKNAFNDLERAPSLLNASDEDNFLKSEIKSICKNFKDKYLSFNEDVYLNIDIKNEQKFIPFILNIVKELDERLFNFEVSTGYFTFAEVASFASKLVKDFPNVREEIKKRIKLIFMDEYTDTNDLQNDFINLISNNNVFVVGDVKQSIYLFRNANPSLFSNLYESYKKSNQAIDMNENFRSRKEVVNKVNEIFNPIMTLKFGGADYRVSQ